MMKNLRYSQEDHLHKPGKVVVRVSIPVAHQIGQVMDSRSRREPLPSDSDRKDNHVAKIGDYRRCQNVSISKAVVAGLELGLRLGLGVRVGVGFGLVT